MYHILVAGAGYTGSVIARFFTAKKQKVYAITRSPEKGRELEAQGIFPQIMDMTQSETLKGLPSAHFVVIAVAPDQRDEASYRRIYVEGVHNLLNAIRKNPRPFLIVYLSSTGVWADQKGEWVDENTAAVPSDWRGRILLEAENQILGSGAPAVIFRLAGIYGPHRTRLSAFDQPVTPEVLASRWMNMIHVDDIARAMPVLFKKAQEGTIYTGVDDTPVAAPDFYRWLGAEIQKPVPFKFTEAAPAGKRIKNTGLKSLGFSFQYPSYREGYAEILARARGGRN